MTRIEGLLATPPAERPRKGPRRWEKSALGGPARWIWWITHKTLRSSPHWPLRAIGWTARHADGTFPCTIEVSPCDPLLMDLGRKPHTQRRRSQVIQWCRQMGSVDLP